MANAEADKYLDFFSPDSPYYSRFRQIDPDGLSPGERTFVNGWHGDLNGACETTGTSLKSGKEMMGLPWVDAAIRKRGLLNGGRAIADKTVRQQFWTDLMGNPMAPIPHRLTASKLLGQAQGDFVQKVEHSGGDSPILVGQAPEIPALVIEDRIKMLIGTVDVSGEDDPPGDPELDALLEGPAEPEEDEDPLGWLG